MRRTEQVQGLRLMKFEEVYGCTHRGGLRQAEAAEVLGVSERTFRRWRDRYEAEGADGLYDRRLGRLSARRAPVDEVARVLELALGHGQALPRERWWPMTSLAAAKAHGRRRAAPRRIDRTGASVPPGSRTARATSGSPRWWDLAPWTMRRYSAFFVAEEGTMSIRRGVRAKGFCSLYADRASHYWNTERGVLPARHERSVSATNAADGGWSPTDVSVCARLLKPVASGWLRGLSLSMGSLDSGAKCNGRLSKSDLDEVGKHCLERPFCSRGICVASGWRRRRRPASPCHRGHRCPDAGVRQRRNRPLAFSIPPFCQDASIVTEPGRHVEHGSEQAMLGEGGIVARVTDLRTARIAQPHGTRSTTSGSRDGGTCHRTAVLLGQSRSQCDP